MFGMKSTYSDRSSVGFEEYIIKTSEGKELWGYGEICYDVNGWKIHYDHNCCVEDDCCDDGDFEVQITDYTIQFWTEEGDEIDYTFTKEEEKEFLKYAEEKAYNDYC